MLATVSERLPILVAICLGLSDNAGEDDIESALDVFSSEAPTQRWTALPGQALVLLPPWEGETENSPAADIAPLRHALIDDNTGYVKVVVSEADYQALKGGIEYFPRHTAVN